jgi:DNA-binding beta-propeller fold protein YncE
MIMLSPPRRLTTAAAQLAALTLVHLFALTAISAESGKEGKLTVQTVATGLQDPRAVAVRPDTGSGADEIFIAETGAGRVVKITAGKNDKPADVVAGFSIKPNSSAGVQSLFFIDRNRLVATGGDDDGKPFVRLYELAESNTPLTADQAKGDADLAESDQQPRLEARAFSSIARSRQNDKVGDFLIVAALGERAPIGIAYIPVRAGTLSDIFPIRLTGPAADIAPAAITVGATGYVVVASKFGQASEQSTKLRFINPISRRVAMEIPLELDQVTALAYSPKTGNLYATGAGKGNGGATGVFRIENADPVTRRVDLIRITALEHPSALSFAPDGSLYVVTTSKDKIKNAGTLVRISGDL